MVLQQYRSTFLAHPRRRMVREGEDGGEGEPSVAMVTGSSRGRACGARSGGSEAVNDGSAMLGVRCSMFSGDPGRGDVVGVCAACSSGFEKGRDAEDGGGVAHVVSGATPHNMFHTAKPAPVTARNTAQEGTRSTG
jgi:hypothetical protein